MFERMKKKWGLHEKNDITKHIDVPWKQRKIAGIILLALVIIKICIFFIKIYMKNPGLEDLIWDAYKTHAKHEIWSNRKIGVVVGTILMIISYSIGAYALLDKNSKLTHGFFKGANKRIMKITIIFSIAYAFSYYYTYTGYESTIHDINEKNHSIGLNKSYHINIKYFIPIIISSIASIISLSVFYMTIKILQRKNNIVFDINNNIKIL